MPCLLLAAGAYCATSFELEVRKVAVCGACREPEPQDLRFLPCTKVRLLVTLGFQLFISVQ